MKAVKKKPEITATIASRLGQLVSQHEHTSQRELAAKIGVPTMVLNRTLRADACPNADAIVKIAQYFNVSTDYLLGLDKLRRKRRASA